MSDLLVNAGKNIKTKKEEMNNLNRHLDFLGLKIHKPHKDLKPYVQCYWSIFKKNEPHRYGN